MIKELKKLESEIETLNKEKANLPQNKFPNIKNTYISIDPYFEKLERDIDFEIKSKKRQRRYILERRSINPFIRNKFF